MSKKKKNSSKINKTLRAVNFIFSLATLAMAIYIKIPKSEKIKGIDTDKLINDHTTDE